MCQRVVYYTFIHVNTVNHFFFVSLKLLCYPPQGCNLIIALTHMRMPNDERLAKSVGEIDIILGGYDHCYEVKVVCL